GDTSFGFKDGANLTTEYTYDANGNMTADENKGITSISYNHLNLPTNVNFVSGDIIYIYDATGVKQKKIVSTGTTTEYAGNYIYEDGTLKMLSHPEGYIEPGNKQFNYIYQFKDHLGNVRLTYADSDGNGSINSSTEIIEENNYYPFGLKHKGYNDVVSANVNSVASRFKFGGKEYNEELGLEWYDVSARNYDPALGRWMNLDPLAEKMRRHSPYNFGFDNPVYFQDYDGMAPSGPGNPIRKLVKKAAKKLGRLGKQKRLRQVLKDPKASKADKGWIKSEMNQMKKSNELGTKRKSIRNPPGKDLAHERGREASKGYGYEHSNLQNRADHRRQHKYDNYGRKNKERPVKEVATTTLAAGTITDEEVSTTDTDSENSNAMLEFSMNYIETMDNLGKNLFGNNSFGNVVDDFFNPFPGFSEFFNILKDDSNTGNGGASNSNNHTLNVNEALPVNTVFPVEENF
ncbi:polymorphic toxin type 8 domain-containing protein, partial [uncultured Winogradskyella sp.]|uniref:polymorphic toxin type 8 domain-containing protein n=1 Tax=uncultured Winogradskyella sp. TaxID=395353 RepID=UPI00262566E3